MDVATSEMSSSVFAAAMYLVIVVLFGGLITVLARWLVGKVAYANAQKQSSVITAAVVTAVDGMQALILDKLTSEDGPIAAVRLAVDEVGDRIGRLERDQFGDNHGGMREALNTTNSLIVNHGRALARVEGRLDEHLRSTSR